MAPPRRHIEVYTECLSKLGYGTPLWSPEPRILVSSRWRRGDHQEEKEVTIGDVGCITDTGSWKCIFNVFEESDCPREVRENRTLELKPRFLKPQVYGILNQSVVDAGFEIGALPM